MTHPHRLGRSPRRALALPAVLLLVFVGLGIALAIHRFSTETYRRTSRGIYATISEVMAESAAEEAWYSVQRDVNTPGTRLYELFRKEDGFADLEVELPVLRGKLGDPQFGGYITDRYDPGGLKAYVAVTWGSPYGSGVQGIGGDGEFDAQAPWERFGTVTITASATAKARIEGLANFRRMIVKRPLRIVKTTPPVPFDRSGLIILYPEHMTNVVVAGLLDNPTNFDVNAAIGGKARLMPMLEKSNRMIEDASNMAREFNDKYKNSCRPPFGDHLTPPPQWLQDVINQMNGICSAATKLDLTGQGRRPFMFDDEVLIARTTMANGSLGNLSEFNYSKNIQTKLGPLNDIADALSKVQKINTDVIKALEYPHQLVPYGAPLNALVVPMYAIVPELVGSVRDVCEGLHEKIMDPVLEICVGVGQVLAIAQKILIEVPMMGQQAFAGFQQQIAGAAGNAIQSNIGTLHLGNDALMGLPTNTPAMGFSLNMPLPNYTTGDEVQQNAGVDGGELVKAAGEALCGALLAMVERELVTFITTQMGKLAAQIPISVAATTAACAGPQAIVTCAPEKLIAAAAFEVINRAVNRGIQQALGRIASFKGNGLNGLIQVITNRIPVFKQNEFLGDAFASLLGAIIQAAYEKRDVSDQVNGFMQQLGQKMAQKMVQQVASGTGLDKVGGVLKGYALRHRFRNLVEFDGSSSMNAFGGQGAVAGSGTDGLNMWRGAFDRVYKESLWRKKATWVVKNADEFEGLRSRYCDGVFAGRPKDPSGDGTNRWRNDSYGPNAISPADRYGLSGIIFYEGSQDLVLNFPGPGDQAFKGKCIIYAPNGSIKVQACRMRDINRDSLTIICGKPVELPSGDVEISVHAIGNGDDCKVKMTGSKITGSLILKRYTVQNQDDPKASLDGTLNYNDRLNGSGGGAIGGMKESHLFVTISPYVISREMETTAP